MSILLSSYHLEFSAGNGWKCNCSIWNQLFLKEERLFLTFPSKSYFLHFWLFSPHFGLYLPFCDQQHGTFLYGRIHINYKSEVRTLSIIIHQLGFTPQPDSVSVNNYLTNRSRERMGDLGDKPIGVKNKWGIQLEFKSQLGCIYLPTSWKKMVKNFRTG